MDNNKKRRVDMNKTILEQAVKNNLKWFMNSGVMLPTVVS